MRILVACEYSGTVRDAFRLYGHDAVSCDLLPTESEGPHLVGDARQFLSLKWDMLIAHPPCTYLCNSGVRWLNDNARWPLMLDAVDLFCAFLNAPIPRLAVENPIMHGYAKLLVGEQQTQIIHPWQFGHPESKATCLWLRNLPLLMPTNAVEGREQRLHKLSPSKDRAAQRSLTYWGVACAMAQQWSF